MIDDLHDQTVYSEFFTKITSKTCTLCEADQYGQISGCFKEGKTNRSSREAIEH